MVIRSFLTNDYAYKFNASLDDTDYDFSSNALLRFRSDADNNKRIFYLDDVEFSGAYNIPSESNVPTTVTNDSITEDQNNNICKQITFHDLKLDGVTSEMVARNPLSFSCLLASSCRIIWPKFNVAVKRRSYPWITHKMFPHIERFVLHSWSRRMDSSLAICCCLNTLPTVDRLGNSKRMDIWR